MGMFTAVPSNPVHVRQSICQETTKSTSENTCIEEDAETSLQLVTLVIHSDEIDPLQERDQLQRYRVRSVK
jgi:hypothetical protein